MRALCSLVIACAFGGCGDDATPRDAGPDAARDAARGDGGADAGGDAGLFVAERTLLVTLDGEPWPDVRVVQGGAPEEHRTGPDGTVVVEVDPTVPGRGLWLIASHPEARTGSVEVEDALELTIALERFETTDNPDYEFRHPGTPEMRHNTSFCGHCHVTFDDQWYASEHRTAAANPVVHDVYAGAAGALDTAAACAAAGGAFRLGLAPGTREPAMRCYLGDGTLPDLNAHCGDDDACDAVATAHGGCADCHAPGIDGVAGGRDLLEATGIAYEYGVHCDVCHKVESVDLEAPPGVAGRLRLLRPSEPSPAPTLGRFLPLQFAPYPDVANRFMGAVPREVFREAVFCAGCHQLDQEALVPGASIDRDRWPDGRLPIHSTYREWADGPLAAGTVCHDCHMPPNLDMLNSADLQMFMVSVGVAGGWPREAGTVRSHSWPGPRHSDRSFLRNAAAVVVRGEVAGGTLFAEVTVRNTGPPHAIPTGEPMRSLVLQVGARCGDEPLEPTGGDAIPDLGGHLARREATEDWTTWPGAEVGQLVRVVRRTGDFYDYVGFGPFGDRFDAAAKGMPVERVVGASTITAMDGDTPIFDRPLPAGDVAYLGEPMATPADGDRARPIAGGPGFAFARVLVGPDGRRMVPHHLAVDVASDNRLLAGEAWTSTHEFAATCAAPVVRAVLTHRAYPFGLAAERRWTLIESLVAEAER